MKVSDFYKDEFVNYSCYDNLRKIASVIDGQKNAARKVLYTVLEKNIKTEIKVQQLGSKVSEFAEYLHGCIDPVIVNLAQDFTGTNNLALMQPCGNFGKRFNPEASASRYIYTHGTDKFFELFKKADCDILINQEFEGHKIEPRFYVPSLPILLINGSEGVSSGFAQKILPRNPDEVKRYIQNYLTGKSTARCKLYPYYKGFNGTIEQGENPQQWSIKGQVTRKGINKVQITEVPIGYNLKGYLNVLDKLEENKVIQGYTDKSENEKFLFDVLIPSKILKTWDDETLLTKLKLIKKVTENYTVINEENKIEVHDDVESLIKKYIKIKLQFLEKRKDHLIKKLDSEIRYDYSKYLFIKMITNDELKINKRKKQVIEKDLEKVKKILTKDGSYDYLLNMAIASLTKERMARLQESIKDKKATLDALKNKTLEDIWMEDLC